MRFFIPKLSHSKKITAEQLRLIQPSMQSLATDLQSRLNNSIELLHEYQQLPYGMNPVDYRRYKEEREAELSIVEVKALISSTHDNASRYLWNKRATEFFNQGTLWSGGSESPFSTLKKKWPKLAPFSYYRSDDLVAIAEKEGPLWKINQYYKVAIVEVNKRIDREKNATRIAALNAFKNYLEDDLNKNLMNLRQDIARAMVARLQLAKKYNDFAFDDVMYHFSEEVASRKIDVPLLNERPYQAERRELTPGKFDFFHRYIMKYGSDESIVACKALPWVQSKQYLYNEKKSTWQVAANLIEGADVPKSRWRPSGLFRGRNARYHAFHKVARVLQVRAVESQASACMKDFSDHSAKEHSEQRYQFLQDQFEMLKKEYARIESLRKGLIPGIHGKARDALKSYRGEIVNGALEVVRAELAAVRRAQDDLVNIVTDEREGIAVLDRLLRLSQSLEKQAAWFSDQQLIDVGTPDVPERKPVKVVIQERISEFRQQLANHKKGQLTTALNRDDPLPLYTQYHPQTKQVLYRKPDPKAVANRLAGISPYLLPEQQQAFALIQQVMQGHYLVEGQPISYQALSDAAAVLSAAPDVLLQSLFDNYIKPIIVAPNTPGHQLLLEYENRAGIEVSQRRSSLLVAVEEANQIELLAALQRVLQNDQDLCLANAEVMVGSQALSVEAFCLRLQFLPSGGMHQALSAYLARYDGENAKLSPLLYVLPEPYAIKYARKRIKALAKNNDWASIINDRHLNIIVERLRSSQSFQKSLLSIVLNVRLQDDVLAQIDEMVAHYANKEVRQNWELRREAHCLERVKQIATGPATDGTTLEALTQYLKDNANLVFSGSYQEKEQLLSAVRHAHYKRWTEAQHAVVNTIKDADVALEYNLQLLKRCLNDVDFAERYKDALLSRLKSTSSRFDLLTAPAFSEICSAALEQLSQQEYVDNFFGLEVLVALLNDGLAESFGLEALVIKSQKQWRRFENQLHIDLLSREIIALIDANQIDKAVDKMHFLRAFHDHHAALNNNDQTTRALDTMQLIFNDIEARMHATGMIFLSENAKALLAPMQGLTVAEPVLWRVENDLALKIQGRQFILELTKVAAKEATTIPSLQLLHHGLSRGYIVLSEAWRLEFIAEAGAILEHADGYGLSQESKTLLTNVLAYFGETQEAEKDQLAQEIAPEIEQGSADHSNQQVDVVKESKTPSFVIEFKASDSDSQKIIDDMQSVNKTYKVAKATLQSLCAQQDEASIAKRNKVFDELLRYSKVAYQLMDDENALREHRNYASEQLTVLWVRINELALTPTVHPFLIIVPSYAEISRKVRRFGESLASLCEGQSTDISILKDPVLLNVVFYGFIDEEVREGLARMITDRILPDINKKLLVVSDALLSILPTLAAALKGDAQENDFQNLQAYGKYCERLENTGSLTSGPTLFAVKNTKDEKKEVVETIEEAQQLQQATA